VLAPAGLTMLIKMGLVSSCGRLGKYGTNIELLTQRISVVAICKQQSSWYLR
jgi:hypothetical protein